MTDLMRKYETLLINHSVTLIAGVDEAGRGPLAGPVVAAAVILKNDANLIYVDDSKKLNFKNRLLAYEEVIDNAHSIGIGFSWPLEIDQLNILEATKIAMKRAIANLSVHPMHVLIDAVSLSLNVPTTSIIKGDQKSISIAAASVVAKVTRDNHMLQMDKLYPEYGFKNHKGYATKQHKEALKIYGITEIHRKTFRPIKTD